jgi:hypothetical protein
MYGADEKEAAHSLDAVSSGNIIQAPGITGFFRPFLRAPEKFALFLSFLPGLAQLPPRYADLAPISE